MRFLEYESWRLKKDIDPDAYDQIIKDWFKFIVDNKKELFPEWVSAKYFRKTDRDGNPNGSFVMLFEYDSLEGHHEYKERRKDWDGPYEAYKKVDPYQEFFELESVTTEYLQPQQEDYWFDYSKEE